MYRQSIYTTGAFLEPIRVKDTDGHWQWRWTVSEFNDETFQHGKPCNPQVSAETEENLLLPDDECDDE